MKYLFFSAITFFSFNFAFAHGVHDSGGVKPQKGGVIRSLETIHVEFVTIGNNLQVYIFNKDKKPKPLATKDYPVSAKVILPRNGGEEKVELTAKQNHWEAQYDAKGVHRYTFEFHIEQGGHRDKLKFTVEPKK